MVEEEEEREVCQSAFPFWRPRLGSSHAPKTFLYTGVGGQNKVGGAPSGEGGAMTVPEKKLVLNGFMRR